MAEDALLLEAARQAAAEAIVTRDPADFYRFDYSKAKPNRFAKPGASRVVVVLDPGIAEVSQCDLLHLGGLNFYPADISGATHTRA